MSADETTYKVTQKLLGKMKKFTVLVVMKSGKEHRVQSEREPEIEFNDKAREAVLKGGYNDTIRLRKIRHNDALFPTSYAAH